MKRFFSLLALLVATVTMGGYVHAQTTYEISSTTRTKATKPNWEFTSNGIVLTISNQNGKASSDGNSKFLKNSLKFAKGTEFTISVPENIKISKINFKGYTNVDNTDEHLIINGIEHSNDAFIGRAQSYYEVKDYTYDWGEGNTLTFKAASNVEMCFIITLTEAASDKLNAPTFSYDEVAGKVTLTANNAKEIRYTTDGTEPSETAGNLYTEPFEASNVTVKAIAISDGTKENSDVATYEVPAKLLSTIVDLTKVTIDGAELSDIDLQTLLNDKSFTSTASYSITPVIKYTETTTKKYNNETSVSTNEEKTATVVRGEDNFTTSFDVNGETYTITIPINKDVTVEAPTHVAVYGTVALSCTTKGATISYKIGDGEYKTYTHPFTILDEDAIVTAKANIGEVETSCEQFTVEALKNTVKTKTIILAQNMFTSSKNTSGNSILTGNAGTDAEGYILELNNNSKSYSSGSNILINGNGYKSIKGSNGSENILHLPEGVNVAKIILYSYVNSDGSNVSGWSTVNGEQEYESIPMGVKGVSSASDPDVRVYPIDNTATTISFNNAGYQLCFVIALDIVDEVAPTTAEIELKEKMATYSNTSAWEIPAGVEAYTAKYDADNSKIKLNKVEDTVVPANTGVVLLGEKGTYTANLTTTTTTLADNDLQSTAAEAYTATDETTYVLVREKDANGNLTGKLCFGRLAQGSTVAAGRAYLTIPAANAAKQISLDFGSTTGINAVESAEEAQNGAYYTLSGQRTMKPAKGVYIHNGKKFMK